jgi:hypothetical protein
LAALALLKLSIRFIQPGFGAALFETFNPLGKIALYFNALLLTWRKSFRKFNRP